MPPISLKTHSTLSVRDAEMAGYVSSTNNSSFPLTLGWIQNNASQTIIYNVANNGVLTRSQYLNNVLQSTTIIANYVNTNGTQTNCSWNSTNDNLTVNMTVSIGTTNTSRQFIINSKEVQGAIILSSTNTTISATANSTIFGRQ